MTEFTQIDWFALAPELSLLATALVVLFTELGLHGERKRRLNPLAIVGFLVALGFVVALAVDGSARSAFGHMFVVDDFALVFKGFFLVVGIVVLLLSYRYFSEIRTYQGEYYFLVTAAFLGMLLMPSARDLVMLFIALELVSVPGFVMAALRKFDLRSNEGALKFFVIGVLSVAVLLFGLSVVYGFTGTTNMEAVAAALAEVDRNPFLLASVLFVIVGFGFKVSAVPFHFWAPDTYEGSPVPVTAFLSVASKAAGFVGLILICFVAFEPLADVWGPVLGVVAVLTMTLGNLTAMQQSNIVRLLAYSSIAHAGYMLVPFAIMQPGEGALNQTALASVLFYLLTYAVMNLAAFGAVVAVTRRHPGRRIEDYAGLGQRSPLVALGLTAGLLSLGGVPPLVGLWAKWFIFLAAVTAGTAGSYALAAAVVVNTVLGMFYYLAVVRTVWMAPAPAQEPLRPGFALGTATVGLATVAVVLFIAVPLVYGPARAAATLAAGGG
jgi:NADH-quinone oxidoreductase subunit N